MGIKKMRERKGVTQIQLSELIGVPQSTIASWETDRSSPRVDRLPIIAKALDCTVDELLGVQRDENA